MPNAFVLSLMPGVQSPFATTDDGLRERYRRLGARYEAGLRELGIAVSVTDAPSIYQTPEARAAMRVVPGSVHVAVRPVADFRPFHGLADYLVFDGPLEELVREVPNSLRTAESILRAAGGVLCTTRQLSEALHARGIATATILPPPMTADQVAGDLGVQALAGPAAPLSLAALSNEARASGGQLLLWNAGEVVDQDAALELILDAAKRSGMRGARCSLVVAGLDRPIDQKRFAGSGIYRVIGPDDDESRKLLARSCDAVLSLSPSGGLDLDVRDAISYGALAIVPAGHSALELAQSQSLLSFDPALRQSRWGRPRAHCPDLARALKEAVGIAPGTRETRRRHARQWIEANEGRAAFAARLASRISAS